MVVAQGSPQAEPWLSRGPELPLGATATPGPGQGHVSCGDSGQGRQERCSNVQLTSGLHLSLLTEAHFGNLGSQK